MQLLRRLSLGVIGLALILTAEEACQKYWY